MKSIELLSKVLPSNVKKGQLNKTQEILFNLVQHFENPDSTSFDLSNLNLLDKDYLLLVIQAIHTYFAEDSYILRGTRILFVDEEDPFVNQSTFATILQKHGFNYDDKKLNVYYSRGKLPMADIEIQGKPYWYQSTVLNFINTKQSSLNYEV